MATQVQFDSCLMQNNLKVQRKNMKNYNKQLLILVSVVCLSGLVWAQTNEGESFDNARMLATYLTSSTRSSVLNSACGSYTREGLLQSEGIEMSQHVSSVNSTIGIDGSAVIKLLVNKNNDAAKTLITDNNSGYLVYVLSFGVGLIILLVISPFLLCCCTCTYCCPPQSCGRASEYQPLQERSVFVALVIFIIFLTLVIGACIYGLIVTGENRTSYKKAGCTAAIMTDDVMNGNSTVNGGSYFMGMNMVPDALSYLQTNLSNIDGNLTQVWNTTPTTTINQAITQSQTAQSDTIKISNNDASGSNLTLTYNTPIDASSTTGSISSNFPSVLGSYSSKTGLVWSLYSSIYSFEQFLSKFKSNASDLHNNLSLYNQVLAWGAANASTLKTSVSKGINDTIDPIQKWSDGADKYEKAVFGYFLGLIGVCLLCGVFGCIAFKFDNGCCRKFMYFFCFILFLACLLSFIISVGYSAVLPVYAWGCNYYNETISSQYYFQNNLNFMFDVSTLQKIGVCMPYDNGDIYEQIATTSGAQQMATLRGIFTSLTTFQLSPYTSSIYTSLNNALTTEDTYALGKLIDITDSSTISVLQVMADYSKGSYTNCNSNLPADSWVPSNSQSSQSTTVIACTATNGQQGTATTCSSGVASTGSCSGCMDSSQVLYRYLNPANILPTDLSSRYGATCSFNTKLNNVWTNYYKVKLTAIGPTVGGTSQSTGVYPRTKTVETDVNSLNSTVTPALSSLFTSINTNMASISSLTDPTYGIFGGLNCSVIGQDAQRVRGTTCGTAFNHTYIIRFVTGIIGYLLLVSLCIIVAFGSKHSRFLEGKNYRDNPSPREDYPVTANPYLPNQYNMNPQSGNLQFPCAYDSNAAFYGEPTM